MICDCLDIKYEQKRPFGFFFDRKGLQVAFIGGYGPDCFYDECEPYKIGKISLTANQLKGK